MQSAAKLKTLVALIVYTKFTNWYNYRLIFDIRYHLSPNKHFQIDLLITYNGTCYLNVFK